MTKTWVRKPKLDKKRVRNPYTFCVRIPYTGSQNASGLAFWELVYGIRTQNLYGFRTRFLATFGFRISVFEIRKASSRQIWDGIWARRMGSLRGSIGKPSGVLAGHPLGALGLDRGSFVGGLMGGSGGIDRGAFEKTQKWIIRTLKEGPLKGVGAFKVKSFATSISSVSDCLAGHPFDGQNRYHSRGALQIETRRIHRECAFSVDEEWNSSPGMVLRVVVFCSMSRATCIRKTMVSALFHMFFHIIKVVASLTSRGTSSIHFYGQLLYIDFCRLVELVMPLSTIATLLYRALTHALSSLLPCASTSFCFCILRDFRVPCRNLNK